MEPGAKPVIPKEAQFNSIVVPTVDTIRHEGSSSSLWWRNVCVLATRAPGRVWVKNYPLMSGDNEELPILCCLAHAANQTQDIADSKLDKRRKGVLGPPARNVSVCR